TKERYALFRIMYEDGEDLPEELAEHVAMLKAPREAPSPNAAELSSRALTARSFGEQDGIDTLKAKLFFRGAIDGGTPFTAVTARTNLSSRFIPQRPVPPGVAPIEQPQPDQAVGYLPTKTACRSKLKAPFTREEEDLISLFTLSPEVHFPYFTAQWKSPFKGQTHEQAIPQGARDGATIINYLHTFYQKARGTNPTLVETCHVSATVDLRTVILWIHWRSPDGSYHMEQIEAGFLDKERDNIGIRAILRNIEDYALSARLESIKTAIDQLKSNPSALSKPE
ncbi:hypothetical protein BU26DRAFT_405887, partial [Trematosphaeria pertusa]